MPTTYADDEVTVDTAAKPRVFSDAEVTPEETASPRSYHDDEVTVDAAPIPRQPAAPKTYDDSEVEVDPNINNLPPDGPQAQTKESLNTRQPFDSVSGMVRQLAPDSVIQPPNAQSTSDNGATAWSDPIGMDGKPVPPIARVPLAPPSMMDMVLHPSQVGGPIPAEQGRANLAEEFGGNVRGVARSVPVGGEMLAKVGEKFGRTINDLMAGSTPEEKAANAQAAQQFFASGQQVLNQTVAPPTNEIGQGIEKFGAGTVEAAPVMAALAPLGIAGKVGEIATRAVSPYVGPLVARVAGGALAAGVGAGEFGASQVAPTAYVEGKPGMIAEGAAAPFVGAGTLAAKIAQGKIGDTTVNEWVNAGFMALGAYSGVRDFNKAQVRSQQLADTLMQAHPDVIGQVRQELQTKAATGDPTAIQAAKAVDDAIAKTFEPANADPQLEANPPTNDVPRGTSPAPEPPPDAPPQRPAPQPAQPTGASGGAPQTPVAAPVRSQVESEPVSREDLGKLPTSKLVELARAKGTDLSKPLTKGDLIDLLTGQAVQGTIDEGPLAVPQAPNNAGLLVAPQPAAIVPSAASGAPAGPVETSGSEASVSPSVGESETQAADQTSRIPASPALSVQQNAALPPSLAAGSRRQSAGFPSGIPRSAGLVSAQSVPVPSQAPAPSIIAPAEAAQGKESTAQDFNNIVRQLDDLGWQPHSLQTERGGMIGDIPTKSAKQAAALADRLRNRPGVEGAMVVGNRARIALLPPPHASKSPPSPSAPQEAAPPTATAEVQPQKASGGDSSTKPLHEMTLAEAKAADERLTTATREHQRFTDSVYSKMGNPAASRAIAAHNKNTVMPEVDRVEAAHRAAVEKATQPSAPIDTISAAKAKLAAAVRSRKRGAVVAAKAELKAAEKAVANQTPVDKVRARVAALGKRVAGGDTTAEAPLKQAKAALTKLESLANRGESMRGREKQPQQFTKKAIDAHLADVARSHPAVTGAHDSINMRLSAMGGLGGEAGASEGENVPESFAIHPDDLKNASAGERLLMQKNGRINEDDAIFIIDKFGQKAYDSAKSELIQGNVGGVRRLMDMAMSENSPFDEKTRLYAHLAKMYDSMSAADRGKGREVVDPAGLPIGTKVKIFGDTFTVEIGDDGTKLLKDGITLDAEQVGGVPVDKGSVKEPEHEAGSEEDAPLKTSGQQLGLLGDKTAGGITGGKTGSMFGNVSGEIESPSMREEAAFRESQTPKDKETAEMFGDDRRAQLSKLAQSDIADHSHKLRDLAKSLSIDASQKTSESLIDAIMEKEGAEQASTVTLGTAGGAAQDIIERGLQAGAKWTIDHTRAGARWVHEEAPKAARSFRDMASALLKRFGAAIRRHLRNIWEMVKEGLAHAQRNAIGAVGDVGEARGEAADALEKMMLPKVTEREALLQRDPVAAKAVRESFDVGKEVGARDAKAALDATIAKIETRKDVAAGVRDQIVRLAKENLPQDLQSQYLVAVRDAKTPTDITNALHRMVAAKTMYDLRRSWADANELADSVDLTKMPPVIRAKAIQAIDAIHAMGMRLASKTGREFTVVNTRGEVYDRRIRHETLEEHISTLRDAVRDSNLARVGQAVDELRSGKPPEKPPVGDAAEGVNTPGPRRSLIPAGADKIRERFAGLAHDFGNRVYGEIIGAATVNKQSENMAGRILDTLKGKTPEETDALRRGLISLGLHQDAEALRAEGKDPVGIPDVGKTEAASLAVNPKIAAAANKWMTEVEPELSRIRDQAGLPVRGWEHGQFRLNLAVKKNPPPLLGLFDNQTAMKKVFNDEAFGTGEYETDPEKVLRGIIGAHLRMESRDNLRRVLQDNNLLIDPSLTYLKDGKRMARVNGKEVAVTEQTVPAASGRGVEPKWVPTDIIKAYKMAGDPNVGQHREDTSLIHKAANAMTTGQLLGGVEIAPHGIRTLGQVGLNLRQSGRPLSTIAAIPWFGSRAGGVIGMRRMAHGPLGETMQVLNERIGADRGMGFMTSEYKEPKTTLGKALAAPHRVLFGNKFGIDTLARRDSQLSGLYVMLGPQYMGDISRSINAGKITPTAAARMIEAKLGRDGIPQLARYVNNSLGHNNPLLRTEWINQGQLIDPFLPTQVAMIPSELSNLVTLGISPPKLAAAVRRGDWKQAAMMLGISLAGGALGIYAMMNAINYGNTKVQLGKGRFMFDNDPGHKFDIWIAPGWHLSNFDPSLSRAARVLGAITALNTEGGAAEKIKAGASDIGRESINEAVGTMNAGLRIILAAGLRKIPYFTKSGDLMKARKSWWYPFGIGQDMVETAMGDSPDASDYTRSGIKTAARVLLGAQLKSDEDFAPSTANNSPPKKHPVIPQHHVPTHR